MEQVSHLLASLSEPGILTDAQGHIEYVNHAWEVLHGYTLAEVRGQTPRVVNSGRTSPEIFVDLWQSIQQGRCWHGELINQRKDKTIYQTQMAIVPLCDNQGALTHFAGIQRDITVDNHLLHLKDQFVADTVHELRTPTANITLYLSLLERTLTEQQDVVRQSRYLGTLQRETARLQRLIDELLILSHFDQNRVELDIQSINLNGFLESHLRPYYNLCEEQGLQLTFEPGNELDFAEMDPLLIVRVVDKLFDNAINYTEAGGQIVIQTQNLYSDGQKWALFSFTDTGYGIPEYEQVKIFQRFYRGEASHRRDIPGTGLGLPLCQEIMKRHTGKLTMGSTLGIGSTFTVWLRSTSKEE